VGVGEAQTELVEDLVRKRLIVTGSTAIKTATIANGKATPFGVPL
jgi:hypothetical protein